MGIIKDWRDDNNGYATVYKIKNFISPKEWYRLHKWRKQRADRGWSDRDTWGAGEHIAQMTAEMLQNLNDHAHTDQWFDLNIIDKQKYKNLQQVIDDINAYLEYEKTGWSDGLDSINDDSDSTSRFAWKWKDIKTSKILTERQITSRIRKWRTGECRAYAKARKAMVFFANNFANFWD